MRIEPRQRKCTARPGSGCRLACVRAPTDGVCKASTSTYCRSSANEKRVRANPNQHTHTHTETETDTQFSPFLQPQIRAVISEMRLPVATLKQLLEGSSIQATPPPFPTLGSSRVPICSFQRCPWRSGFLLRGPRAQRLLRLLTLIPGLELGMQKQATPYTSSKRLSLRCFFRRRASVHVAIGPKAERRIFPTESFTRLSLCSSRCGTRAPSRASTSAGCRRFPHFRASA